MPWMIYGATGFTGALIARRAKERGETPILAGRRREAVEALARELDLPARVFAVEDAAQHTRDVTAVLHCAGPFAATASPMIEACLGAGASYLDITGELPVFERAFTYDDRARAAGIAIVPGVGADVVPSDCLASHLAHALPGADSLELACRFSTTPSLGTIATLLEQVPAGGAVIRGGAKQRVGHARFRRRAQFPDGERYIASAPWGDLAPAHRATGIPDVTVYLAMPRALALGLRATSPMSSLMRFAFVRRFWLRVAKRWAAKDVPKADGWLCWWGEARRGEDVLTATIRVPDPYAFTIDSALAAVDRVLAGDFAPGAGTPSQTFGRGFALALPGVALDGVPTEHSADARQRTLSNAR